MSEKGRLVEEVLEQIIKIIPKTELLLIHHLNKFRASLDHKAPEMRRSSDCWKPFINILNYYIPEKKHDWQIQIREILVGDQS